MSCFTEKVRKNCYCVGQKNTAKGIKNYEKCYFNRCFKEDNIENPLYDSEGGDSSRLFIITNRHVLLGNDKKSLKKAPSLQVKLNFFNNSDNSKIQKDYTFICIEGENTFYHPDFDIAVIDISKFIKEEEKKDNIQLHYKAFRTHNIGAHIYPTQVLFMTGYPRGL